MAVALKVQVLPHGRGLPLPAYQTAGAAGMDVCAAVDLPLVLAPGGRAAVPTGLRVAVPSGFELQVRPRSGLAMRDGLTVVNAPGTVDSDYRGEVKVLLVNLGDRDVVIERGTRVAQVVLAPVIQALVEVVESLDDTLRGEGGFGSTGQ